MKKKKKLKKKKFNDRQHQFLFFLTLPLLLYKVDEICKQQKVRDTYWRPKISEW